MTSLVETIARYDDDTRIPAPCSPQDVQDLLAVWRDGKSIPALTDAIEALLSRTSAPRAKVIDEPTLPTATSCAPNDDHADAVDASEHTEAIVLADTGLLSKGDVVRGVAIGGCFIVRHPGEALLVEGEFQRSKNGKPLSAGAVNQRRYRSRVKEILRDPKMNSRQRAPKLDRATAFAAVELVLELPPDQRSFAWRDLTGRSNEVFWKWTQRYRSAQKTDKLGTK